MLIIFLCCWEVGVYIYKVLDFIYQNRKSIFRDNPNHTKGKMHILFRKLNSLALLFTPIKSGLPRLKIYNNILILHHLHIFIQISKMKIPTHTFRCFWCTTVFCIIHDFFGYVMLTILSNLVLIIVESSNLGFFLIILK
jgi:hypothetical protein